MGDKRIEVESAFNVQPIWEPGTNHITDLRIEKQITTYPITRDGRRQWSQGIRETFDMGSVTPHQVGSLVGALTSWLAYVADGTCERDNGNGSDAFKS